NVEAGCTSIRARRSQRSHHRDTRHRLPVDGSSGATREEPLDLPSQSTSTKNRERFGCLAFSDSIYLVQSTRYPALGAVGYPAVRVVGSMVDHAVRALGNLCKTRPLC